MRHNHSLLNGAHPLMSVRAIRRDGRRLQSCLRAQHRSHQVNWPLKGSLGSCEESVPECSAVSAICGTRPARGCSKPGHSTP